MLLYQFTTLITSGEVGVVPFTSLLHSVANLRYSRNTE